VCPRKHARASSVFPLPSGLDDGAVREFQSSILRPPLTRPPTLLPKKDLISGSFNYDNKFSLDAKNAVPVDGLKLSCSATTKNGSTEPTGVVKSVFDVAKVRTDLSHVQARSAKRIGSITCATVCFGRNSYQLLLVPPTGVLWQKDTALCHFTRSHTPVPGPMPRTTEYTRPTLSNPGYTRHGLPDPFHFHRTRAFPLKPKPRFRAAR